MDVCTQKALKDYSTYLNRPHAFTGVGLTSEGNVVLCYHSAHLSRAVHKNIDCFLLDDR